MNDVFISYSRRDKVFTQKLVEALKAQGRELWADWEDIPPGSDWFAEIKQGIEESQSVLFVLSPEWIKSNECHKEMDYAVQMGKRLVPVIWQNVDPKEAPPELAKINWIFMRETDDFDKGFQLVSATLDTDLDWLKSHTRLQTRALEWDKKNKDHSFVLRGKDLEEAEQFMSHGVHKDPEPTSLQGEYILVSRKDATRRQRQTLAGVIMALVVSVMLGIVALFQRQLAVTAQATAQAASTLAVGNASTAQANLFIAQTAQVQAKDNAATAVANEQEAKRQALLALARQWAAEARSLIADPLGNNDLAALLSLESLKIGGYTPQADAELVESVSHLYTERIFEYGPANDQNDWATVAITPDDKTIVIGGVTKDSDVISLYDLASGEKRGAINMDAFINGVAVSPDGTLLAVAEGDGTAVLIDLATLKTVNKFTHPASLSSVAFSPDGKYLLFGSYDNTAFLWDVATGETVTTFSGHTNRVRSVAFSQDGRFVFTSGLDQLAIQWNLTGARIASVQEYNEINSVAVTKDGNYLATVTDRKATIWNLNTLTPMYDSVRHPDWVQSVAFSPDDKYFVTGGDDKIARIWDTQTGQLMRALVGHTDQISSVAYTSDGKHVITGSTDGTVRVWSADPLNVRMILPGHKNTVNDVAVSPDGKTIATGSWDEDMTNNYKLWDVQTGEPINALLGHTWLSSNVSFSKDGRYILTSNGDGAARIFDAKTADLIRTIDVSPGQWVNDAAFSPDGKFVLAGGDDQTATLWNAQTGDKILTMDHPERVTSVAYSPDGKFAATAARDEIIRLWDLSTGNLVQTLTGHVKPANGYLDIQRLVFSADGKYIASASADGTARLWEAATGNVIQILKHNGPVYSVAISPDEKYILTGGADRAARLWDLQTGTLIRTFTGHGDAIFDVAFSPDGSFIVTASADTTARIWDTELAGTVKRVCSLLLRDFTNEERLKYGITDKDPTCPNK